MGKTNELLNAINCKVCSEKNKLYAKDPYKTKYQFLMNTWKCEGVKHCNDSKSFTEYENDTDNIHENIEEYNPNKERKMLFMFDDMIADILSNRSSDWIIF